MNRLRHEVRDPIYGFIEYNNLERDIFNSLAYQRLRNVHQLALTSLIYPGATHKRFEHCLGVMHLTGEVFDKVFHDDALEGRVRDHLKPHLYNRTYWRQVLRIAALLHDVGHLPFSHAAEKELLPAGWDHERMTAEFIRNSEIADILNSHSVPIKVEDVIDLAWQPSKRQKHEPDKMPNVWKTLLNEIITGDTFGTDRIDYLLRDAYHAGVAYGRFDIHRLVNGLIIELDEEQNPILAIEYGSIHAAESLLLARYFMYTQVYMHRLRRAYDEHLKDFMAAWLPGNRFTESWRDMLAMDDNRVFSAMWEASLSVDHPNQELADRIVRRKHFKSVYELNPGHKRLHPTMVEDVYRHLSTKLGPQYVRKNDYTKGEPSHFRVKLANDELSYGNVVSPDVIGKLPPIDIGFVFVDPSRRDEASALVSSEFKTVFEGKKMPRRRQKKAN